VIVGFGVLLGVIVGLGVLVGVGVGPCVHLKQSDFIFLFGIILNNP
jgi:hypothetical protein